MNQPRADGVFCLFQAQKPSFWSMRQKISVWINDLFNITTKKNGHSGTLSETLLTVRVAYNENSDMLNFLFWTHQFESLQRNSTQIHRTPIRDADEASLQNRHGAQHVHPPTSFRKSFGTVKVEVDLKVFTTSTHSATCVFVCVLTYLWLLVLCKAPPLNQQRQQSWKKKKKTQHQPKTHRSWKKRYRKTPKLNQSFCRDEQIYLNVIEVISSVPFSGFSSICNYLGHCSSWSREVFSPKSFNVSLNWMFCCLKACRNLLTGTTGSLGVSAQFSGLIWITNVWTAVPPKTDGPVCWLMQGSEHFYCHQTAVFALSDLLVLKLKCFSKTSTHLCHGVGFTACTLPLLAHSGWIHTITRWNTETQRMKHVCVCG